MATHFNIYLAMICTSEVLSLCFVSVSLTAQKYLSINKQTNNASFSTESKSSKWQGMNNRRYLIYCHLFIQFINHRQFRASIGSALTAWHCRSSMGFLMTPTLTQTFKNQLWLWFQMSALTDSDSTALAGLRRQWIFGDSDSDSGFQNRLWLWLWSELSTPTDYNSDYGTLKGLRRGSNFGDWLRLQLLKSTLTPTRRLRSELSTPTDFMTPTPEPYWQLSRQGAANHMFRGGLWH